MIAHASGPAVTKSETVLPRSDVGYSSAPVATKLGLKDGQVVVFVALPEPLAWLAQTKSFAKVSLVADMPEFRPPDRSVDLLHGFFTEAAALRAALPLFRAAIRDAGSIWISWPKKSANVRSDLSDEVVRRAALAIELVDIKVCAVDTVWSGLKLVIPRDKRPLPAA